jgi:mannose-1-phosphate guanylyltransferase
MKSPIVPIILAGGSGKRFWPLSRASKPKQFLTLLGDQSLIEDTYDRVQMGTGDDGPAGGARTIIVTAADQVPLVETCLGERPYHVVAEPCARNTGPAIALALAHARHAADGEDPIVGVFASDHYIPDIPDFHRNLRAAAAFATRTDRIVTIGLVPTQPETGYGYIQRSDTVLTEAEGLRFHDVERFVEKPDMETATRYMRDGAYLWNSGMFVARAGRLQEEIARHTPDIAAGIASLSETLGRPEYEERLSEVFPRLPSVSIDYGVMEKTAAIGVLPASFAWSDVGSWDALLPFKKEGQANFIHGESVVEHDCDGIVVLRETTGERLLAVCGLKGVGVVETRDATLVLNLDDAQQVRKILEKIEADEATRSFL